MLLAINQQSCKWGHKRGGETLASGHTEEFEHFLLKGGHLLMESVPYFQFANKRSSFYWIF